MSLRLNQILGGADIRSPIFYDSNDTNYYIDAASTSVINILQFAANTAQIIGNTSSSYGSLDVRGVRNGWRGIHFNAGGNAPHLMFDGSANGGVYFETGGRWASYYSYGNNCWGFGTSTTNSAYNIYAPTGVYSGGRVDGTIFYDSNDSTYYVDPASFSLTSSIGIGGLTSSNNVQMYDSYVDASSSYLQSPPLIIRKDSSATGAIDQAPVGLFIYNLNGTNNTWTKLSMGSREAAGAGNTVSIAGLAAQKTAGTANNWATGNLHFWTKAGGTQITNMVAYSAGYVQSDYSFRSPIFYDSNNTSYYLDPASTSNLNVVNLVGITGAGNAYIQTTSTGTSYTSHFQIREASGGGGNTSEIYAPALGFHWSGVVASNILMESSGRIAIRNNPGSGYENFIANAIYGAVFYDSNDVTYYTDPSSLSNILELKTNKNWYDSSASAWGGGINMGGNNPTIGFQSTSSTWWYMLHHASSNINFYRRSTSGSWNHDGIWDSSGNFIWQGSSVRAPIFYDQNNTAYYIDAASTSNLNAITAAGNITAAQYYTGGWFRNNGSGNGLYNESTGQHFYSDSANYWNVASSANAQGIRLRTGGHNGTVRGYFYADTNNDVGFLNQDGSWRLRVVGGDYALADGSSMRAQIFYDSNDTNYYVNPASTSVLNSLTVTDANLELYKSQTVDMSNTTTYSTSNYYPVTIPVPTEGCIIQIQNNLNSNVPSWATHGSGFTLNLKWRTNGFGWGTTQVRRIIDQYFEQFTNQTICGGITQMGNSSTEVVWLRGGGQYYFKFSRNLSATAQSATYTVSSQSVSPTSTAQNTIWSSAGGSSIQYNDQTISTTNMYTPVLYDWNNSAYYVDPASTSNLVGLTVANTITGSITGNAGGSSASCTGNAATATRTSGQSGYPHAGTGMFAFYNWGGSDGGTSAPSASTYTTGLSVGSNPGDQAYGFQIANNMWNTGLWTRNYNSGFGSWIRLLDSSNYVGYSAFTGNVDGTQFRDANNTAYYIDPASTSNLVGLTVANTITGAVSGNAGSVTINYNNDSNSTYQMLWGSGNNVYGTAGVYLNPSTDYVTATSFNASDWFRSSGATGWYNSTYGGGIYMTDTTWVRTYNSKYFYCDTIIQAGSDMRSPVYYDANDTAYYVDAASTSNLLLVKTRNTFGERVAVSATASTTINTQYNVTELTLAATITTLTLSNIQASGTVHMWTIVTVGGGVGYSITWPAAVKWPGGTAPTLTTTSNKRDIYQFVTYDGGTTIFAIIVGQNL